jgi:Aldehyde dehydrogenase family
VRDGVAEAQKCALACDFYAEHAERFLARAPVTTEARTSFITFNPLGVVLAVMPWNFPFWQVFRFAASPATGTCGLKRSPADAEPDSQPQGSPVTSVGIVRRTGAWSGTRASAPPLAQLAHSVTRTRFSIATAEHDTALQILGNCTSYTRKIHALKMDRRRLAITQRWSEQRSAVGMSLAPSPTLQSLL